MRLEITPKQAALHEPDDPKMGTGNVLWSGGIGLARYLEHRYGSDGLAGRRVLELGCGCGLVSLAAAALGASVTATDLPDVLSLVTAPNMAANCGSLLGTVVTRELVWGSTALEPHFGAGSGWWDLVD
uniref:Calmodulin-lysine N-methyltransferase n=1 Tax=Haptolina brevifila TaxID=156173 RepID=A0A7S2G4P6_9EUKA|mmetsp:Transcript_26774/g.53803  ORF Transcript_26774/g.53803 Transcript_26774/m.53803 type:complete len:128 (+) Transcript_26774:3-386(+)